LNHNLCLKNEAFLSDTLIPIAANPADELIPRRRTRVNRYRVAAFSSELLHEMWPRVFTCFTGGSIPRLRKFKRIVKKIGFWGWLLIVLGVAGEGIFETLQNRAEGELQTFNQILLTDAQRRAGSAKDSAEVASSAASNAIDESAKATASASNALNIASGARREADSFENDIRSAKTQAAEAESHLAEALKQAANATEELNRLKSPRVLTNAPQLSSELKQFAGTEYTFSSLFGDGESVDLLKQIDTALQTCGVEACKAFSRAPNSIECVRHRTGFWRGSRGVNGC
jgi:hypothetical protein